MVFSSVSVFSLRKVFFILVDQDANELSDENFILEDLVLAKGYKDKIQTSGVYESQKLRGMNDIDKHILKVIIKYLTI